MKTPLDLYGLYMYTYETLGDLYGLCISTCTITDYHYHLIYTRGESAEGTSRS
jgi:hypothetical protein